MDKETKSEDKLQRIYNSNILTFIVTTVLFIYGYYTHSINQVILELLEFTVIFEIIRIFNHYLKNGEFKVRYVIDAAIFYVIKELYIGFITYKINQDYGIIILCLISISILIILRWINLILIENKIKV